MKILVVVDMQNDFVDGALGTKEATAIVPNVVAKIQDFDGVIAVTYDTHGDDYLETQEGKVLPVPHCINGTKGHELFPAIRDAIDARIAGGAKVEHFEKDTFGSIELARWAFMESTRLFGPELDEIVFVGLCTDICVVSNALIVKTYLPNTQITVDASCCAGVTPESHAAALATMKMCQVNVENWEG